MDQLQIFSFKNKDLKFLLIGLLVAFFAYSNVIHGDLQFDDEQNLFEKPFLRSLHAFSQENPISLFSRGERPVVAATFAANYTFWGRDTYSYHLTNLIIHLINGILVYILVQSVLLAERDIKPGQHDDIKIRCLPLLTTAIFLLHPIGTQAVSYIVQRGESLASTFYLLSMIIFTRSLYQEGRKKIFSLICFSALLLIGIGAKEIVITLPLAATAFVFIFSEGGKRRENIVFPLALLVLGLIFSLYRLITLKAGSAGLYIGDFTPLEYLYTQFGVINNYIKLILFPAGQSIDHLYPVSKKLLQAKVLINLLLIILIILPAFLFSKRWRAGSFFTLWFFILLAPSSSVLPIKDVMVEHRAYLPGLGIYFLIANFFTWQLATIKNSLIRYKSLISAFFIILFIAFLFTGTYKRNNIWKSREAMWSDVVRKYPQSARGHHNLGNSYYLSGQHVKALRHYLKSLDYAVANMDIYYNLGLVFEALNMSHLAKDFFIYFISFSESEYGGLKKKLQKDYGLRGNENPQDIIYLKKKASAALRQISGQN